MNQVINNKKLKLTPQRMAILAYLNGNKEHPSAEDIHRTIVRTYPSLSLATVYNTLELLKERGQVREVHIDPRKKRFDPDTADHQHLICTRCRKIVDVNVEYKVHLPPTERGDFDIIGSHIEFYGICPSCKDKG